MFPIFNNASKGKPSKFYDSIDNTNKNLKIGIKSVSGRVGWYNIEEELEWRYVANGGGPSESFIIQPGLYSFEVLAYVFTSEIDGLKIDVDRKTAKIDMTIPENIEIWQPDRVKKLFGIDDEGWLTEIGYIGDHSVEFSPQGISVCLKQLSTTDNFLNNEPSQFLGFIPITDAPFGEYFMVEYTVTL